MLPAMLLLDLFFLLAFFFLCKIWCKFFADFFLTWKSEKRKFWNKLITSECNLFKSFLGIKRRTSLYTPILDFSSLNNVCSAEGRCCSNRGSKWVGMAEWSTHQQSESWVRVLVTAVALLDSLITFQVCSGLHACLAHSDLKDFVHNFFFLLYLVELDEERKEANIYVTSLICTVVCWVIFYTVFYSWYETTGSKGFYQFIFWLCIHWFFPVMSPSLFNSRCTRLTCKSLWCSILTNPGNMKL